jgi:cbb3-type cytochrome oxidase maturation protein
MSVLYVLIPLALVTGAAAVAAFLWATKNGQLDDLDTPAIRILNDDDASSRREVTSRSEIDGDPPGSNPS